VQAALRAAVVVALRETRPQKRYGLTSGVSLISPPIGSAPLRRSPSGHMASCFGAARSDSGLEGTDESFLGDVGDKHAILEKAAGR
jgi:hypothetical protein